MASNTSRLVLMRSVATSRWLSTATAAEAKSKEASLYWKLSALKGADGDVAETLDNWVKEGKSVKRFDIISCVNQLRRFKKYKHAAQVCIELFVQFPVCLVSETTSNLKKGKENVDYLVLQCFFSSFFSLPMIKKRFCLLGRSGNRKK